MVLKELMNYMNCVYIICEFIWNQFRIGIYS